MALNTEYETTLTYWDFLEGVQNGTISFHVDKGLAVQLANMGYQGGKVSSLIMVCGVIAFFASIPLAIFYSWFSGLSIGCFSFLLMKTSPYFLIRKIQFDVLEDPNVYRMLRDSKVIVIQSNAG